jgi:hypothetical protein
MNVFKQIKHFKYEKCDFLHENHSYYVIKVKKIKVKCISASSIHLVFIRELIVHLLNPNEEKKLLEKNSVC